MSQRLLLAGGAGQFPRSSPSVVTLTSAPNGGMNPWMVPGASCHNGVVTFGWVDNSGNIECATYTEATATVSAVRTIHASFEDDAHSSPLLHRRSSDGKFVCIYSLHNAGTINRRISTNADDVSAWGAATNLESQLGGTRYTDAQLVELSDGTLFLFYRDEPSAGTDSRWCYAKSTDGGVNWSAQTILFRIASNRSYVVMWKAPFSDRIHFATTNGGATVGGITGFSRLGHFSMDGLTLARYKSDGTSIGASLPLSFTDITTVYTGTSGVFPSNLAFDASSHPVISGQDDMNYTYHRWSGSAWVNTVVASAGTGYEYGGPGAGFAPWGNAVDDGNPNDLWLLRDTGGNPGLWRYRTADGGATFTGFLIAAGNTSQQEVICVRSPSNLRAMWQTGSWTYWNNGDWNVGTSGVVNSQ